MGWDSSGTKSSEKANRPANKSKKFDIMKKPEEKRSSHRTKAGRRETCNNYKYCGNTQDPQTCLAYSKNCSRCAKLNHYE